MLSVIPLGVFAGACMTLQARVNASLTDHINDATLAATISFGGGLVLLALAMVFAPAARAKFAIASRGIARGEFPWWLTIGGAAGAFYVYGQGAAVPMLGIALFTIAYVAAQTFGSLAWDRLGVSPSGAHMLTPSRVGGAGLAVAAVIVTVLAAHNGAASASWLLALPVIAGLSTSWQQAANGRVRVYSQSVLATTFWNFCVGTAVLVVLLLVQHLSEAWPTAMPSDWWLYTGGPIGIVFIATAAVLVRRTGVLLMSLLLTLGQLGAALALAPLTPSAPQPELGTYLGTLLAVLAVGVMLIPSRQSASR